VIEFNNISKTFDLGGGFFSKEKKIIHALRDVSLTIKKGMTMGIVGESGSGKSTLARIFMGLYKPDTGYFKFSDFNSHNISKEEWKTFRKQAAMVFQDPYSSLNPRMKVLDILQEPFLIHKKDFSISKEERLIKITKVLDMTGLEKGSLKKYPHEFSGGQRQRIGIARALVLKPRVLVLDEPVSALDVSIQAQILNLLKELKKELDLTYIFIAHDLGVIEYMSDRIAVMYLGSILEESAVKNIFSKPRHHYTKTLLNSMPDVQKKGKDFQVVPGEIPSPLNLPKGCPFEPRCAGAKENCGLLFPVETAGKNGYYKCHYPLN